jgi:hypothetical protein
MVRPASLGIISIIVGVDVGMISIIVGVDD